ncbi:hypothetical protein GJ744_005761 [Endocarpon pusillum]|uniref:Uncharacterized protein n=1 Tax=Endocarpon pusillum TaxID=364733 RepID=A0A8H7APP0_9EURO|nr:hypothetical protein GJ744_005761 [Endocarpon pusillum]
MFGSLKRVSFSAFNKRAAVVRLPRLSEALKRKTARKRLPSGTGFMVAEQPPALITNRIPQHPG